MLKRKKIRQHDNPFPLSCQVFELAAKMKYDLIVNYFDGPIGATRGHEPLLNPLAPSKDEKN